MSAVLMDIVPVFDQLILHLLFQVSQAVTEMRQAVNHIFHQVKTVHIIEHRHIEGRCNGAFFLIAPHMNIIMIRAPVG